MNSPPKDDSDPAGASEDLRLGEFLREVELPYVDDAGFTACVIGRLPPSAGRRAWRRLGLVGSATALGVAIAGFCAGPALLEAGAAGWAVLRAWSLQTVPVAGMAFTIGSLVVLGAALAVSWRSYSFRG